MATFTITHDDNSRALLNAGPSAAKLWEAEITKFHCPEHSRTAHLHIVSGGNADAAATVEACCREFFEFCLRALNGFHASDSPPGDTSSAANSRSAAPNA